MKGGTLIVYVHALAQIILLDWLHWYFFTMISVFSNKLLLYI